MDHFRIEEASFNAWPSLHQVLYDGWLLRFSEGYTKRANSINLLSPSTVEMDEKINHCEAMYDSLGLPTIFRLTSFSQSNTLDKFLEQKNYEFLDRTFVMVKPLEKTLSLDEDNLGEISFVTLEEWISVFSCLNETATQKHSVHKKMLERILNPCCFAILKSQGEIVACGLGVLEGTVFGLFDLVTKREQRGKGYGGKLLNDMLRWAHQRGSTLSYLQVVATNEVAVRLYKKIGFQEAYTYWYRIKELKSKKKATVERIT